MSYDPKAIPVTLTSDEIFVLRMVALGDRKTWMEELLVSAEKKLFDARTAAVDEHLREVKNRTISQGLR